MEDSDSRQRGVMKKMSLSWFDAICGSLYFSTCTRDYPLYMKFSGLILFLKVDQLRRGRKD
jgi:hypothetical protein